MGLRTSEQPLRSRLTADAGTAILAPKVHTRHFPSETVFLIHRGRCVCARWLPAHPHDWDGRIAGHAQQRRSHCRGPATRLPTSRFVASPPSALQPARRRCSSRSVPILGSCSDCAPRDLTRRCTSAESLRGAAGLKALVDRPRIAAGFRDQLGDAQPLQLHSRARGFAVVPVALRACVGRCVRANLASIAIPFPASLMTHASTARQASRLIPPRLATPVWAAAARSSSSASSNAARPSYS